MESSEHGLGNLKTVESMEQFFLGQSEILRKIVSSPLVGRVDSLTLLLTAISDTCRGITILAKNGLLNECYMLSRALLERTVNCFYLLVCDDEEFERYDLHTIQKGFKSLDKECKAGDFAVRLHFTGDINKESVPRLEEALDTFTSPRGRQITHWTTKSILERVSVISQRSKVKVEAILLANLIIYEDSSDVAAHTGLPHFDHNLLPTI